MDVSLKPEIQRFIDDQVKAGRYGSAQEVVEDAMARLMEEDVPALDEATLDAAEAQIARGEARDWKEVAEELRRKYLDK